MSLLRQSIQDIEYSEVIVPAETSFYTNAFAGDYDDNQLEDPYTFNPKRYLGEVDGTPHYAYGAESRMCIKAYLANREIFTFFYSAHRSISNSWTYKQGTRSSFGCNGSQCLSHGSYGSVPDVHMSFQA